MELFYISCAVIVSLCGYLTVAQCYKTGFFGAVGFGIAALGAGVIVFEVLSGTEYTVPYEVAFIPIGMALYLAQTAWRARHHGVKARNRRRSDAGQLQAGRAERGCVVIPVPARSDSKTAEV